MPAPVTIWHFDAVGLEQLDGGLDLPNRLGDRAAPLLRRAQVLGRAVIGVQPGEAQVGAARRCACARRKRRLARRDAAAAGADVDLHVHVQLDARSAAPPAADRAMLSEIVDAHADARLARELGQARELGRADHLVGDQHVAHAAAHHRLGLADLLAAHADRAARDLRQRDLRALVGLGVRPHAHRACRAGCGSARRGCARTRPGRAAARACPPRRAACRRAAGGGRAEGVGGAWFDLGWQGQSAARQDSAPAASGQAGPEQLATRIVARGAKRTSTSGLAAGVELCDPAVRAARAGNSSLLRGRAASGAESMCRDSLGRMRKAGRRVRAARVAVLAAGQRRGR